MQNKPILCLGREKNLTTCKVCNVKAITFETVPVLTGSLATVLQPHRKSQIIEFLIAQFRIEDYN